MRGIAISPPHLEHHFPPPRTIDTNPQTQTIGSNGAVCGAATYSTAHVPWGTWGNAERQTREIEISSQASQYNRHHTHHTDIAEGGSCCFCWIRSVTSARVMRRRAGPYENRRPARRLCYLLWLDHFSLRGSILEATRVGRRRGVGYGMGWDGMSPSTEGILSRLEIESPRLVWQGKRLSALVAGGCFCRSQ